MLNQPISSPIMTKIFGFLIAAFETGFAGACADEAALVLAAIVIVGISFDFAYAFKLVQFCVPTETLSAREKVIIDFATPDMSDLF